MGEAAQGGRAPRECTVAALAGDDQQPEHGVKKIIPDAGTQQAAYRRALKNEFIKRQFDALKTEADEYAAAADVPALKRKVAKLLKDDPTLPWDAAIHTIARAQLRDVRFDN